jgi:hypothetical protein
MPRPNAEGEAVPATPSAWGRRLKQIIAPALFPTEFIGAEIGSIKPRHYAAFNHRLDLPVTASSPVISPRISQSTRAGGWVASIVWISSGR